MQHDVVDLFQAALELDSGDVIVIPCRGFKEMEAIRTAFYRELTKLRHLSKDLAAEIGVHRKIADDTYSVVLSKMKTEVSRAFIITSIGKVKEIDKVKVKEAKRLEQLMIEDGYSQNQIDEHKKSQVDFSLPEDEEEESEDENE